MNTTRQSTELTPEQLEAREELDQLLARRRQIDAEIDRQQASFDERIKKIQDQKTAVVAALQLSRREINERIERLARSRRSLLLTGRLKTVKLAHGAISFREPAKDSFEVVDEEAAYQFIKAHHWSHLFIRYTRTIPKSLLHRHKKIAKTIPGVKYTPPGEETIDIKPMKIELDPPGSSTKAA